MRTYSFVLFPIVFYGHSTSCKILPAAKKIRRQSHWVLAPLQEHSTHGLTCTMYKSLELDFMDQVTQVEIDAGAVQLVAVVTATDSQGEELDADGTDEITLDRDNGLSLCEFPAGVRL